MLVKSRRLTYSLALLFAVAAVVAMAIDMPIARCATKSWPIGDLRKAIDVSEVFAHGLGVLLILVTVAVLDPLSWRRLPRVAACAFGAGSLAQLAKLLLPRIRPHEFDLSGNAWSSFFVFGGAEFAQSSHLSGRAIQSFPSGHSATAVGLAFGLAWLYPRGRWLFAFFAFLSALQRIQSMAHFVSDALAGAALACLVAGMCWDDRFLNRLFVRLETNSGLPQIAAGQGCERAATAAPTESCRPAA